MRAVARAVFLCLAMLWGAGAAAQGPLLSDNAESIAVVVGNKAYKQTSAVDFAHNDAEAIKAYLTGTLGFREQNVFLMKDATLGELTQMFGSEANPQGGKLWRSAVEGRSNVFVYYSGHGVPDLATRQPFLLPQDGNPNASESGYALQTLYRNLELVRQKIGAQRQLIVMIDACFTGETGRKGESLLAISAPGFTPAKPRTGGGIVKLVATSGTTPANWDEGQKLGLFTSRFLMGAAGLAQPGEAKSVSIADLRRYVTETVAATARRDSGREQVPEIDEASFALPIGRPVPAVAHLVAAARDEDAWRQARASGQRSALEDYIASCLVSCRYRDEAMGQLRELQRNALVALDRENWQRLSAAGRYEDYVKGCGAICAYRGIAEGYLGQASVAAPAPATGSQQPAALRSYKLPEGAALVPQIGHFGSVRSVAISPNGRLVLSGSEDATLKLWDVATGRLLRTFEGHSQTIHSVAFSADGRSALSGSRDDTLKLWDVASGRLLRAFEGHSGIVSSVAFSPDGRSALSGSYDQTLKLWDVVSGKLIRTFKGHSEPVYSVAFSADGRTALSGGNDRSLRLWDIAGGQLLRSLDGHTAGISAVQFSPDGRSILSASDDKTLKLWDVASGRLLQTLAGHSDGVKSVTLSPDGRNALSAGKDKALKHWDIAGGRLVRSFQGDAYNANSIAFSSDGRNVLLSDGGAVPKLWDMTSGRFVRSFEGHTNSVLSVAFAPDGRSALSGSSESLDLWDLASGRVIRSFKGHAGAVTSVALSPDGRNALSGSYDKSVRLWDVASGGLVRMFEEPAGVVSVAFSPDGRSVLSGTRYDTVTAWDLTSGRSVFSLKHQSSPIPTSFMFPSSSISVAVSPDGQTVLSGSSDDTKAPLKLWDAKTGRLVRSWKDDSSSAEFLAFSPDGRTVLSGSSGSLKLRSLASGGVIRSFKVDDVSSLAFSPDGRSALSGSLNAAMKLWDVSTGRLIRSFDGETKPLTTSVAFSPDGQTALAGNRKGKPLELWHVATGNLLASYLVDREGFVAFRPDGSFVASGDPSKRFAIVRGTDLFPLDEFIAARRRDQLDLVIGPVKR